MAESTTLTIRLPTETKHKLSRLAEYTRRKQSFLGAEAIADFVARELAIIEGIEAGLEDVRAGRIEPHDTVMAEIDAILGVSPQAKE